METAILQEPLRCKRGQTYDEVFEFTDEAGAAINVSTWAFSFALRESIQQKDPVSATAVCTNQNTNEVRIVIAANVTAGLKVRTYKADLRAAHDGGVDYPFEGEFIIEEAITRS